MHFEIKRSQGDMTEADFSAFIANEFEGGGMTFDPPDKVRLCKAEKEGKDNAYFFLLEWKKIEDAPEPRRCAYRVSQSQLLELGQTILDALLPQKTYVLLKEA